MKRAHSIELPSEFDDVVVAPVVAHALDHLAGGCQVLTGFVPVALC